MPRPALRSRSKKRRYVRTPGGDVKIHYKKKKKGVPKCALCKKPLRGVPADPRDLSKTEKRPNRPFGGYLCHKCLENLILKETLKAGSQ